MSMIFVECEEWLSETAHAALLDSWKRIVGTDPGAPKMVVMEKGMHVVAATRDMDLCRVSLEAEEEAVIERILKTAVERET